MSWRTEPPFRADHVGSLLRPPALLQAARADHAAGTHRRRRAARGRGRGDPRRRAHAGGHRPAARDRRRAAPRLLAHGLHLPARRRAQARSRTSRSSSTTRAAASSSRPPALRIDAPVRLEHTIFGDDFAFLRDAVTTAVPKLTIPSPSMVHYRGGRSAIDETVYPDLDAFWDDLTAAYREEITPARRARLHLPAAGRHEPRVPQRSRRSASTSPRSAATRSTSTRSTSATSTRPSRAAPRACASRRTCAAATSARRGSPRAATSTSPRCCSTSSQVDGFFMEYDDERSGGFEPLRFLPPGKLVVLGLVTTKQRRARAQGRAQAPHRGGGAGSSTSTSSASRRSAASRRRSTATT